MKRANTCFLICAMLFLMLFLASCACEYHDLEEEILYEATCTYDGCKREYCVKCDYSVETAIPSSHSFDFEKVLIQSTCTEDGIALYRCSGCGEIKENTMYAAHSFSGNTCTVCGQIKSDIKADTWYTFTADRAVNCQNAEVNDAVHMAQAGVYMITYYPVCSSCHISGRMEMDGVKIGSPFSQTYRCKSCNANTYIRFNIGVQ